MFEDIGVFGADDSADYRIKFYQVSEDITYDDYVLEISNGYY